MLSKLFPIDLVGTKVGKAGAGGPNDLAEKHMSLNHGDVSSGSLVVGGYQPWYC